MLPFARMLEYGNVRVNDYLGYNFDTSESYGRVNVSTSVIYGTAVSTAIPVPYAGYSNMLRLTNSTINMLPDGALSSIGTKDFEYTLIFYLYPGGTSYDYIMNFNLNQTEDSVMMVRITDSGLGNRLQFSVGAYDISNRISCNRTRTDLEGKVNKLVVRRVGGVITSYLNDVQMLMGAWTNASTKSTFANSSSVHVTKYYFGEYDGSAKFGSDIGYIDFRFNFLGE